MKGGNKFMYLHLGEGHMIPAVDVIMIGNFNTTSSNITEEFLNISREEGFIIDYTTGGNPRSFVLTEENIYLSIISSTTLEKRMNKFIRNGGI